MIRFKLDELFPQIPAFRGKLERAKRHSPPGKWRPYLALSFTTEQSDDTDQWFAVLNWKLMEGSGTYPCRDSGKNETISRMDPPDYHPTERIAHLLGQQCIARFREQYNEWIKTDFGNEVSLDG